MTRTHLALVGLMGSGKSTIGALVASDLHLPLVDVDDAVRARTGCTVEELWRHGGEDAYRPFEREIVVEALDASTPAVLAAPGGVVDDPGALDAVARRHVGVVYLRADPELLARRVQQDSQPRPLVGTDPHGVLAAQHTARDGRYRSLAHLVLQVDGLTAADAADRILAADLVRPANTIRS